MKIHTYFVKFLIIAFLLIFTWLPNTVKATMLDVVFTANVISYTPTFTEPTINLTLRFDDLSDEIIHRGVWNGEQLLSNSATEYNIWQPLFIIDDNVANFLGVNRKLDIIPDSVISFDETSVPTTGIAEIFFRYGYYMAVGFDFIPWTVGGFKVSDPTALVLLGALSYQASPTADPELVLNLGITQVSINETPIPEPTTMLLLGTGLVGVAGAARRKKKNQA